MSYFACSQMKILKVTIKKYKKFTTLKNIEIMNLIPVFSTLKELKLSISCHVDERNPNIVKITWTNKPENPNVVWESYDSFSVLEDTRTMYFNASCELKIDFDKILHLWDNETDEKYSNIRKPFKNENGTKLAIAASFPHFLEKVIPIIESNDNELLKEFFYDCRGRIIGNIKGF